MKYILYGGGIDSTALIPYVKDRDPRVELSLIHVDYGQKAILSELAAAGFFAGRYGATVIRLKTDLSYSASTIMRSTPVGCISDNRLELRNLVLIGLASSFIASKSLDESTLYIGYHWEPRDMPYPDASSEFFNSIKDTVKYGTSAKISLEAPFLNLNRYQIFEYAAFRDQTIINRSFTCYEEGPHECGICVHCKQKASMVSEISRIHPFLRVGQ